MKLVDYHLRMQHINLHLLICASCLTHHLKAFGALGVFLIPSHVTSKF